MLLAFRTFARAAQAKTFGKNVWGEIFLAEARQSS
jgi:hypothetical protein